MLIASLCICSLATPWTPRAAAAAAVHVHVHHGRRTVTDGAGFEIMKGLAQSNGVSCCAACLGPQEDACMCDRNGWSFLRATLCSRFLSTSTYRSCCEKGPKEDFAMAGRDSLGGGDFGSGEVSALCVFLASNSQRNGRACNSFVSGLVQCLHLQCYSTLMSWERIVACSRPTDLTSIRLCWQR